MITTTAATYLLSTVDEDVKIRWNGSLFIFSCFFIYLYYLSCLTIVSVDGKTKENWVILCLIALNKQKVGKHCLISC